MKVEDNYQSPPVQAVTFFQLFRFADKTDKILLYLGTIFAVASGALMPFMSWILGQMTNEFGPDVSGDLFVQVAWKFAKYYAYVGCAAFICSFIMVTSFMSAGQRQTNKFRQAYFEAIVNQNVRWFDKDIKPQEITTKVAAETLALQTGIGEKVSTFLNTMSMTISAFLIGFLRGWQLALIMVGAMPFLTMAMMFFVWAIQNIYKLRATAYVQCGAKAEEALAAIRTVKMLRGEEYETSIYAKILGQSMGQLLKYSLIMGLATGLVFFTNFIQYAVGFYAGSKFIENQVENPVTHEFYSAGDVLVIFFAITTGASALGQIQPCIQAFTTAQVSVQQAFNVIDQTKPLIEEERQKQLEIEQQLKPEIRFNNVTFSYPSDPEKIILKNFNLVVPPNKKVALVGSSGSGKSTVCQLIEGFYEVKEGTITIGNQDIRNLSKRHLRSQLGYVGQEPTLFSLTIKENLLLAKEDATDQDINEALEQAQAWGFVSSLIDGINTFVGPAGNCQLSGGQKQRIAIARALIHKPQILLFDEATSALDRENEQLIQKTLDDLAINRTTIIVAHRLSTIQSADLIVVLKDGEIVEQGTHDQLLLNNQHYATLFQKQIHKTSDQDYDQKSESKDQFDGGIDLQDKNQDQTLTTPLLNKKQDQVNIEVKQTDSAPPAPSLDGQLILKLLAYNSEKLYWLILSCIFSFVNGAIYPVFALLLGKIMNVLSSVNILPDYRYEINKMIFYFIGMSFIALFSYTTRSVFSANFGEHLTNKVRTNLFKKYLKLPISYFDLPENSAGALSSKLATDAACVRNLCCDIVAALITAFGSLLTGLFISFFYSWKLSLTSLAFLPLNILGGKVQASLSQGLTKDNEKAFAAAYSILMECAVSIRTVKSLNANVVMQTRFIQKIQEPLEQGLKKAWYQGLALGFSQLTIFVCYGWVFYWGAFYYQDKSFAERGQMFSCVFALVFAGFGAGSAFQLMPDVGQANNAAKYFYETLEKTDEDDLNEGLNQVQISKPRIEFRNVSFKYPSRQEQIFQGISFTVEPGTKVAFVGQSGSGKSTILQLLLRFYDVDQGQIEIDGINIKNIPIYQLRQLFGTVSQEPVLFDTTIEENIKYNSNATFEGVFNAAKNANALGFILDEEEQITEINSSANQDHGQVNKSLDQNVNITINQPNGQAQEKFQRNVGSKGSKISGGQKQRIAIARAIIQNPQIVLLDEATSALDANNEQIVQNSLDNLIKNLTSITVSHRISSILKSDKIISLQNGKIMGQGPIRSINNDEKIIILEDGHEIKF